MPEASFLLETARLLLRPWKDEDLDPFARLCADPEVIKDLWRKKRWKVGEKAEVGTGL